MGAAIDLHRFDDRFDQLFDERFEERWATAQTQEVSRGHREVLAFPASWLLDLPRALSLVLHVPNVGEVRAARGVGSTASNTVFASASNIVFDHSEWRALVIAVEADRVWQSDLRAFCERKREEPSWRLTTELALGGAQPDHDEKWSVARVLRRIGAELVRVEVATVYNEDAA